MSSFNLQKMFSLDISLTKYFTKTIIPLTLIAYESKAFGLMGY